MFDLFDVRWDAVDLQHVRRFLADADEEGVTWEAKADDERGKLRPDSIRKAACGLANQIGGYLFLGARHDKEHCWTLPGLEISDPEPKLWVSKILGNLRPVPRFDPKAWELDDGRIVLVVRIDPVAEPPCMTPNGRVYERVSSETLPVDDPALLDKLFRRGEMARERAAASAVRAAERALEVPSWWSQRSVGLAIAAAPIGRETNDISSRLLTKATRQAITESMWSMLGILRPTVQPDEVEVLQNQDAFAVLGHFEERRHFEPDQSVKYQFQSTWLVRAGWDGSVAAGLTLSDGDVSQAPPVETMLDAAWQAIMPLLDRLGGYGPAHLTAMIATTKTTQSLVRGQVAYAPGRPPKSDTLYANLDAITKMDRIVDSDTVDPAIVASLGREVKRAAGLIEDEPDPAEPSDD